ncbi:hypothetical protein COO60DRAFT_721186 [Scenedesmus sp. NREL 46B-D3]|nr:hypothetical protein COO60DRAFT_721186 [Scenedesmus sp. NREL 46B-D3]
MNWNGTTSGCRASMTSVPQQTLKTATSRAQRASNSSSRTTTAVRMTVNCPVRRKKGSRGMKGMDGQVTQRRNALMQMQMQRVSSRGSSSGSGGGCSRQAGAALHRAQSSSTVMMLMMTLLSLRKCLLKIVVRCVMKSKQRSKVGAHQHSVGIFFVLCLQHRLAGLWYCLRLLIFCTSPVQTFECECVQPLVVLININDAGQPSSLASISCLVRQCQRCGTDAAKQPTGLPLLLLCHSCSVIRTRCTG